MKEKSQVISVKSTWLQNLHRSLKIFKDLYFVHPLKKEIAKIFAKPSKLLTKTVKNI